jgi:hypothetical protein
VILLEKKKERVEAREVFVVVRIEDLNGISVCSWKRVEY